MDKYLIRNITRVLKDNVEIQKYYYDYLNQLIKKDNFLSFFI